METLFEVTQQAFQPTNLLLVVAGTIIGIVAGAIPGLTVTMSIALILPVTFVLPPELGLAAIMGIFVGGTYGGSVPSILLNIPGTPASMMTGVDGYPLAKSGRAGTALGVATIASFVGGIISGLVLILVAAKIGSIALRFGPAEYFAITVFALSLVAGIVGKDILKGIASGLIGVAVTLVGADPVTGAQRYSFDSVYMAGGLSLVPILVGLFGFREVLLQSEQVLSEYSIVRRINRVIPSKRDIRRILPTALRGGAIGTAVGIVPGAGGPIASFMAYDTEKRLRNRDDTFGKGDIRGVAASEAANNGTNGGALVPLLTLGVPGDGATAVMLGAFVMNNITPGPTLFVQNADLVGSIYANYIIACVLVLVFGLIAARMFMQVVKVPQRILVPIISAVCVAGAFSVNNSIFDVGLMVVMGIIGYCLDKRGFPVIAMVLGVVLGQLFEINLRQAVQLSGGDALFIIKQPIAGSILALALLVLLLPALRKVVAIARR